MLRVLLLLTVAAVVSSSQGPSHCCSHGDREIVQEQWAHLWEDVESSKMKIGFGRLIFEKMFEAVPATKDLFKRVLPNGDTKSGEFAAHCMRIVNGLDMLINLLDDHDALESAVEHLAEQHSHREGIKKQHFVGFFKILEVGLPKILPKYSPNAWKACAMGLVNQIARKLT